MKYEKPVLLDGAELIFERGFTHEGRTVLHASVRLPQCRGHDSRTRRIDRYYERMARSYLKYCELFAAGQAQRALADTDAPCVRAELTYRKTLSQEGLCSLYIDAAERGGVPPRLIVRRGDTWDLHEGYPLPLSAFCSEKNIRRLLLRAAYEQAKCQQAAGVAEYYGNLTARLRRSFNAENFYLTPDTFCWFYQMYAIAPAMEGIPVFSLPFDGTRIILP